MIANARFGGNQKVGCVARLSARPNMFKTTLNMRETYSYALDDDFLVALSETARCVGEKHIEPCERNWRSRPVAELQQHNIVLALRIRTCCGTNIVLRNVLQHLVFNRNNIGFREGITSTLVQC